MDIPTGLVHATLVHDITVLYVWTNAKKKSHLHFTLAHILFYHMQIQKTQRYTVV